MDRGSRIARLKELAIEAIKLSEDESESLIEEGLVIDEKTFLPDLMDSIGLSTLLSLVETEWGFTFPEEEITPELFEDLSAIAAAVEAKLS